MRLHPAYRVIEAAEAAWSRDRHQAQQRAVMLVRALYDAGLLPGARVENGNVVVDDVPQT